MGWSNDYLIAVGSSTATNPKILKFLAGGTYVGDIQCAEYPICLTADSNGNIYVAEVRNTIEIFNHNELQFAIVEGSPNPQEIAVGSSGNIYIADQSGIYVITKKGTSSPIPSNKPEPKPQDTLPAQYTLSTFVAGESRGIAISPNGSRIYSSTTLTDTFTVNNTLRTKHLDAITIYNRDGMLATTWDTGFQYPHGITVDKNEAIYICDTYNDRILKTDTSGQMLLNINNKTDPNCKVSSPCGITVDNAGNIYVIQYPDTTIGYCIQKFDNYGRQVHAWGTIGTGNGQFLNYPYASTMGIAVDTTQEIVYATDLINFRIQKFDTSGNFLGIFCLCSGRPQAIAVDKDGKVYVASMDSKLSIYSSNGKLISTESSAQDPYGITISPDGLIYVAGRSDQKIYLLKK